MLNASVSGFDPKRKSADRDARSMSDIEQIYLDGGCSFALPWLELKER